MEHASIRRYGNIVLARPVSFFFLTMLFSGIAGGIIAFFILFSYTRTAQVTGILLPRHGLIRVLSVQGGVVAERRVQEGQSVKSGDVLFVLTSERTSATQGNAEQVISSLLSTRRGSLLGEQEQLRIQFNQRIDAARHRAEALCAEIGLIQTQIELQQSRVELSEAALKRYLELVAANFVSAVQLHEKQADLLDQQQRLNDLQRAKAASERELAANQANLRDLQIQSRRDQQSNERNIAAIEQDLTENEAHRQIQVRAPENGIVTAITAELGQTVPGNQSLAAILPAGSELEAELYVPSRSAGFLKPGMEVLLRHQAYAYQKFGQTRGTVREVSSSAMRPEELSLSGAAFVAGAPSAPLYRVRATLDHQSITVYGTEQPLHAGASVDASIALDNRRLYEWVLEPLYAVIDRI